MNENKFGIGERKIKFRAWDKEKKMMIENVGFSDSDMGRTYTREMFMVDDGKDSFGLYWIPMQYTGLKDKNGKEIYEGDILGIKTMYRGDIEDKLFIVLLREGYGEFIFSSVRADTDGEIYCHPCFERGMVNIVGNIFETPNLISERFS